MTRMHFDPRTGAFSAIESYDSEIVARLNEHLTDIRGWLDVKLQTGRYSLGFAIDICLPSFASQLDPYSIYDEIGALEGAADRKSVTKKAKLLKGPLAGFWSKHYFQASFLAKNLLDESERMERNGDWERLFRPHLGKFIEECAEDIVQDVTIGNLERRSARRAITGEFIVFEKREDGSNYYLTLGKHGEWDAILARIEAYKLLDERKAD